MFCRRQHTKNYIVITVAVLMMAASIAAQPQVEFFRLGVKEHIVDSLWALQQTQPVDTSLLDSVRSPFRIGVQVSAPAVTMAFGSGTLWVHADVNAAASDSPAVVIDSISQFNQIVRDTGLIGGLASLAPTVSRWLAEHGAARLKRVFADAVPGQTFTA